ncbi:MAG: hypothetical protein ACT4P0_03425 [Panacagrimonas sp.]
MVHRILIALAPLAITLLFGWLSVGGHLAANGDQVGISLVIPSFVWSVLYVIAVFLPQPRRAPLVKGAFIAAAYATGLWVLTWIVIIGYLWSRFGGAE